MAIVSLISRDCWYKHEDNYLENSTNEYQENSSTEIIPKLFDLMEQFGERVNMIENQL